MKSIGFCRLALVAAIVVATVSSVGTASSNDDGKTLFLSNKCNNCHAVQAAGITRTATPSANAKTPPDLSTAGKSHTAAWIAKFLKKEEAISGRKHMLKFKGTDQELATLSSWLVGLASTH